MDTDKAFQMFYQLVSSIGLFNCEYWLPLIISKKSFNNSEMPLSFLENLKLEKISRMVLGVHKKTK